MNRSGQTLCHCLEHTHQILLLHYLTENAVFLCLNLRMTITQVP